MLNDENQWKRATYTNYVMGGVGVLALVAQNPLSEVLGFDVAAPAIGALGAAIGMHFLLFRRPTERATPEERDRLETIEAKSYRQMFWLMLVMAFCGLGLALTEPGGPVFWVSVGVIAVSCIALFVVAVRSLKISRQSRIDPDLFDERKRLVFDKAQSKGFTAMFNAAIIGGAFHVISEIDVPTWLAFYGPASIGCLAMMWHMSKDADLPEAE